MQHTSRMSILEYILEKLEIFMKSKGVQRAEARTYLNADGVVLRTDATPPLWLHLGLNPILLTLVFVFGLGLLPGGVYAAVGIAMVVLTLAERRWPARFDWVQDHDEWLQVFAMFLISALSLTLVEAAAAFVPTQWFSSIHSAVDVIWPAQTSLIVGGLVAFTIMQFMAYWAHRWQHEITHLWFTFGHGTHHSYTKLNAINWNTAHPFEALFLTLPAVFVATVLGQPDAALLGAGMVMVQTSVGHTNLRLNERFIGRIVTTQSQHMQHHSSRFREAQTNYGCAMTFWDRVFGTFSAKDTEKLGDPMSGERTIWRRLTVPLKRPRNYRFWRYRRDR